MIKSFKYAFSGMKVFFNEERNAKIHVILFFLSVAMGVFLKISVNEWIAVFVCSALVFTSETFNTAIENLCDFVCEQKNPKIKKIKDLSAAAVLFSSLFALVVGLIIFLPKVLIVIK